jgi:hypothetical protein
MWKLEEPFNFFSQLATSLSRNYLHFLYFFADGFFKRALQCLVYGPTIIIDCMQVNLDPCHVLSGFDEFDTRLGEAYFSLFVQVPRCHFECLLAHSEKRINVLRRGLVVIGQVAMMFF